MGALGLVALASPASAQGTDERNGAFSCRASLLKLQQAGEDPALEPVIANEQGSPCVDDEAGLLARQIFPPDTPQDEPHAELGILFAKTDATEDDPATEEDELAAHAESGVAFVLLTDGENTLIAQVVTAEADGRCVNGQPELSGRSAVVSLTILQPGEEPTVIAVPGDNERLALPDTATDDPNDELALHLNETIEEDTDNDGTNDKLTQRAIWLEAEQGDIILGEAVADFTGNPCEPVVEQGRIVIVKDTEPEDRQDFTFNGTVDDDGTFQLDDDGNDEGAGPETAGDDDLPNSAAFDRPPSQFTLTEEEVEGFELEDIDCDDENSEENEDTRSVVINLEDGETVTCTFKNVRDEQGQVTVVKDTHPDDPQDFAFELDCEDAEGDEEDDEDGPAQEEDCDQEFLLDDDEDHPDGDDTLPDNRRFTVPAGRVEIEEEGNDEDGFDLESITCTGPQEGERQEIEEDGEGGEVEFNLEDGEEVTCTFKNVREQAPRDGKVIVKKETNPDGDPQEFHFELDRTQGQGSQHEEFDLSDGEQAEFDVQPGEVTIEEDEVDGFSTTVSCEPEPDEEVDQEGRRVKFDLSADETVTCTFTNTRDEDVPECRDGQDNDGDGKIDFPADPGCENPDDDDERDEDVPECRDGQDNDGDGKIDFPADPGCENPDDDDERDEVEPEPQPGQGTIEIRKAIVNTDPDGAGPFEFDGTDPIGEFSLAHGDEREFNVPAGQYEIEELDDPNDGFRLWRIECDEEAGDETQGPAHGGGNTARIDLDSGEDITCSFYNARDDDPDPGNSGPGNANPDDGGGSGNSGSGSRSARLSLLDRVVTLLR